MDANVLPSRAYKNSEKHLPSFVALHDELKAAGAEVIACVSVNDAVVMREWGLAQKVDGKVLLLADADGSFSDGIGELQPSTKNYGRRSSRYAMVVNKDMKVEVVLKESDSGFGATSGESVLKYLTGE